MEEEIWKPLVYNGISYEGSYEVCNFGKIRSVDRYITQVSGKGREYQHFVKGRILSSFVASQYEHVQISVGGKKSVHVLVHRAVAESFVPNPNKEEFTDVNHIDENKLNNRWDNLEWCSKSYNQKYSAERHIDERLKNFHKDDFEYKPREYHPCPICGKMIKRGVCCSVKCAGIKRRKYGSYYSGKRKFIGSHNPKERKVKWPSREELKQLVRNNSFVSIGKMFGVCDNSIRKWCKYYNIPFKQKDIKSYTDEEWEKI